MKCNIIGNGSSQSLFDGNPSYTVCLNYKSIDNPDVLFAIDDIAIDYLRDNNFFALPSVISELREVSNDHIIDRVRSYRGEPIPIELEGYDDNHKPSFNAGHACYLWTRKMKFTEIHLWGFDSLFNLSLVSSSDPIYNHSYEYKTSNKFKWKAIGYNDIWNKIIDTTTVIHIPVNNNVLIENSNVEVIHHGVG